MDQPTVSPVSPLAPQPEAAPPAGRSRPSRRAVLVGTGMAATALTAAACSSDARPVQGGAADPGTPTATDASGRAVLAHTADVPVGGGVIMSGVVLTQPRKDEFLAFDPVCPHQGCFVTSVRSGLINCPCHGSTFTLEGARESGPTPSGLTPVEIQVEGDEILQG